MTTTFITQGELSAAYSLSHDRQKRQYVVLQAVPTCSVAVCSRYWSLTAQDLSNPGVKRGPGSTKSTRKAALTCTHSFMRRVC